MKLIILYSLLTFFVNFYSTQSYCQNPEKDSLNTNSIVKASPRRLVSKCEDYKTSTITESQGTIVVAICVHPDGYVVSAELKKSSFENTSPDLINKIVECVKSYKYEKVSHSTVSCGDITIKFSAK